MTFCCKSTYIDRMKLNVPINSTQLDLQHDIYYKTSFLKKIIVTKFTFFQKKHFSWVRIRSTTLLHTWFCQTVWAALVFNWGLVTGNGHLVWNNQVTSEIDL